TGRAPLVIANAYDADPDSPLSRTLIKHSPLGVLRGTMIAAVAVGAREAIVYLHPKAEDERRALESELAKLEGSLGGVLISVALGATLAEILDAAGGVIGELKGIHVGGPTGGILSATRRGTRLDFDELRAAGTHMGSGQIRAIAEGTCIVAEAAKLFAYLAKETCGICVPCRVGTAAAQG